MATVEVRDETVVLAAREVLAALIADAGRWGLWWPGLEVRVAADRGRDGMAWTVAGPLVGVAEVVLVEVGDDRTPHAVAVRYVLDVDPTMPGSRTSPRRLPDSPHGRRELDDLRRQQAIAWKRTVWAIKDEVEVAVHVEQRTARYEA